jgi:hypothetical protein
MDNDNYGGLDKAFNTVEAVNNPTPKKRPAKKISEDQVGDDHEYARANLYSLIEKGQEAVDGALDVAQGSDHPRAYEVAGQLIKHVGDVADKLMTLQKMTKDVKEEAKRGPSTVNNALFVGSTADLQKMLKNASKDK